MALEFIFSPLLNLPAWLSIFILSVIVSLIITIVQKYTTDQAFLKKARDDLKAMQKEISELSKKNPKKALEKQSKMMEINSKIMMQSFKPMIFYMIPILVIFSWIMANYGVVGVIQNQDFDMSIALNSGATGNITIDSGMLELKSQATQAIDSNNILFSFKGASSGIYPVKISYGSEEYVLDVSISEDGNNAGITSVPKQSNFFGISYGSTDGKIASGSNIFSISLVLDKFKPFGKYFNILGYYPGCIMTYLIFSMISSILIRKWMKVY